MLYVVIKKMKYDESYNFDREVLVNLFFYYLFETNCYGRLLFFFCANLQPDMHFLFAFVTTANT